MIARIWHGRTHAARADEYLHYLQETGIPMYRATPGNLGIHVLRSTEDGVTDWLLLTFWSSAEDVAPSPGRTSCTLPTSPRTSVSCSSSSRARGTTRS